MRSLVMLARNWVARISLRDWAKAGEEGMYVGLKISVQRVRAIMCREAAVRIVFATGELLGGNVRGILRVWRKVSHWEWSCENVGGGKGGD